MPYSKIVNHECKFVAKMRNSTLILIAVVMTVCIFANVTGVTRCKGKPSK